MNKPLIQIFTDGSCNTECNFGGWAAILLFPKEKKILRGTVHNTTHNRMELLAVINAIEFANNKFADAIFQIFSDSQYVCLIPERKEKLKKNQFLTKKGIPIQNTDLVQKIIHQIESHQIEFIKVKAHQKSVNTGLDDDLAGIIDYNREVDKLAREMVRELMRKMNKKLF